VTNKLTVSNCRNWALSDFMLRNWSAKTAELTEKEIGQEKSEVAGEGEMSF